MADCSDITGTSISVPYSGSTLAQAAIVFVTSTGSSGSVNTPNITSVTDTLGNTYRKFRKVNGSTTQSGHTYPISIEMWGADGFIQGAGTVTITMDASCNPGQDNGGPWAGGFIMGGYSNVGGDTAAISAIGSGTVWTDATTVSFYDTVLPGTGTTGALFDFVYAFAGINLNGAGFHSYSPGGSGPGSSGQIWSTFVLRNGVPVDDSAGMMGALGSQAGWTFSVAGFATPSTPVLALGAVMIESSPAASHLLPILGVGA